MNTRRASIFILFIALIPGLIACEGPAGPEGPRGPEGSQGEVGPAGEDGSKIYADEGAPSDDIGTIGDYYLNTTTGEYHGPKTTQGWGSPTIVLKGQDGKDGEDGEDGSQIFSGNGAPDQTLGEVGDYYLDKVNYELYGPKFTLLNTNSAIWGVPINLKGADGADGADGNANVTRYIYPGHDFDGEEIWEGIRHSLVLPSETEMRQSVWLMYGLKTSSDDIYSIPGSGGVENNFYDFRLKWLSGISAAQFHIFKVGGHGIKFNRFEIVRIESSNTVDFTGIDDPRLPNLDFSNYNEVALHYGFNGKVVNSN